MSSSELVEGVGHDHDAEVADRSVLKVWPLQRCPSAGASINAVPYYYMASNTIQKYRTGMPPAELSLAGTSWGMTTANVNLPRNLGIDAEPEVYQALSAVNAAIGLSSSRTDPEARIKATSTAFDDVIEVCTKVGVIK